MKQTKTLTQIVGLIFFTSIWSLASAQNVVITNARIIDGTGRVIEQGSVVVEGGRITSVSEGVIAQRELEIDVQGMTVMPGLIDSHTHLLLKARRLHEEAERSRWMSDELPSNLAAYLANGVTTLMSHGDLFPEIMEVKQLIEIGELSGPRLLVSGPFLTTTDGHPIRMLCNGAAPICRTSLIAELDDPESARAKVRELGDAGVDAIKIVYDDGFPQDPRPKLTDAVLLAIADEAQRLGLPLVAHAPETADALRVIEFGAVRLAHPPVIGASDLAELGQVLKNASIPFATTSHSRAHNGVGAEARMNRFLDGVLALKEAGAIIALGTDGPGSNPTEAVAHEIETISRILSPAEVVATITLNAATYVGLVDEIGTLEPGKLADIIVIDGDPLADISDLANVKVVIQRGKIVVDSR